jgi:hypothetical protein
MDYWPNRARLGRTLHVMAVRAIRPARSVLRSGSVPRREALAWPSPGGRELIGIGRVIGTLSRARDAVYCTAAG